LLVHHKFYIDALIGKLFDLLINLGESMVEILPINQGILEILWDSSGFFTALILGFGFRESGLNCGISMILCDGSGHFLDFDLGELGQKK